MRRVLLLLIVIAVLAGGPSLLLGQNAGGIAAYTALIVSPPGALPPAATSLLLGENATPEFSLRYGQWSESPVTTRNYGVTAGLPLARTATIGATAGYVHPSCAGCEPSWMMDVAAEQRYALSSNTDTADGSFVVYALTENVGFARSSAARATSVSITGPTAMVFKAYGAIIATFVAPGWGFGQLTNGRTDGGIRPMLGGGVAMARRGGGLDLTLSAERIRTDRARTVFGMTVAMRER